MMRANRAAAGGPAIDPLVAGIVAAERSHSGLRQDRSAQFGVGERPDVGALIEESFAARIHDDAVEIVIAFEDRAEFK